LALPEHKQLAVVPFKALTFERAEDPPGVVTLGLIGSGLAEALRARLSGLPGLQIVRREDLVLANEHEPDSLATARAAGANLVLTGALQRKDGRMQVDYFVGDAHERPHAARPTRTFVVPASGFLAFLDVLADGVAMDLGYPAASRHTAIPAGLNPEQQAQYLEAVGLLLDGGSRQSLDRALKLLHVLATDRPKSGLVQAAVGRANLALYRLTNDRVFIDSALAAASAARELDPSLADVDLTIGEALRAAGRTEDSLKAFRRALVLDPNQVAALLGFAGTSETAGDSAEAEAALRKALDLQPFSIGVSNQLGALLYELGRFHEAAEMFRRVTEFAPESFYAFNNLGGTLTMNCELPEAFRAFRKSLELQPKNSAAASNLGLLEVWMGHPTEAVSYLEQAAAEAPSDFEIQANLGDAYRAQRDASKSAEAYARSIALARQRLASDGGDATARSVLATGLAMTGNTADANREMKRALELTDMDPVVLVDAAIVAVVGGHDPEALGYLRRAVEAGYCPQIIAKGPEFERFATNPEFQAILTLRPKSGS
jgi:Flp pilus assembly protein TadD/TolB-like protein